MNITRTIIFDAEWKKAGTTSVLVAKFDDGFPLSDPEIALAVVFKKNSVETILQGHTVSGAPFVEAVTRLFEEHNIPIKTEWIGFRPSGLWGKHKMLSVDTEATMYAFPDSGVMFRGDSEGAVKKMLEADLTN